MTERERLVYEIDVVPDGAKKGFASFRDEVGQADGVVGKFKAGASNAFSQISANAGMMAVAAGGALLAFGAKAVNAFTETAKAAIDLHTATGLQIEDSSRWIAVADDYQVSAEALATGLGKVAKTLDDEKWSRYGIATRDAAGKARDVNDILLDTFDMLSKVTNETERARIGQELFGKGYQSLTPLLGHTRAEYEKMLETQKDGQVITEAEAEKAEKTRLAYDELHDSLKEFTLLIGQELAPAAASGAENVAKLVSQVLALRDALNGIPGMPKTVQLWWDYFSPRAMLATNIERVYGKVTELGKGLLGLGGDAETAAEKNARLSETFESQANSAGVARGAAAAHAHELTYSQDRITQYHAAVDLATTALEREAEAELRAADAAKRHQDAIDAVREAEDRRIAAALRAVGGDIGLQAARQDAFEAFRDVDMSFDEKLATILGAAQQIAAIRQTQLEAGGNRIDQRVQAQLLKDALADMANLFGGIFTGGSEQALGDALAAALTGYIADVNASLSSRGGTVLNGIQRFAEGGWVKGPPGSAQLAVVHAGEYVSSASQMAAGGAGTSVTIPVTVNAGIGTDGYQVGRQVVEAIDGYLRSGGQLAPNTLRLIRGK